jgi:DNA-binding NtrC family response regulator
MAPTSDDDAREALDRLAEIRLRTAPHTQEALRLRNELRTRFGLKRPEDAVVCIQRFLGRSSLPDALAGRLSLEWPLAVALDAAINLEAWKSARGLFEEVVRATPAAPRLAAIAASAKKAREVAWAMASLVGKSAAMDHVRTQTWRAVFTDDVRKALALKAPHKLPVLITGESGTGKELVARTVAAARGEAESGEPAPYVALNIASVAPSLVNSALFGHVKGAFTGATTDRAGVFRAAHGGVLFLDEIGDASPAVQVRLLRTLQEGTVRPVGADAEEDVTVRVLAATNRDLAAPPRKPRKGDPPPFRRDLLERLSVLRVHCPPLRERLEDVPELVRHFVAEAIDVEAFPQLVDQVFARLETETAEHRWPGNVRELAAAVDRIVAGQAAVLSERELEEERDDILGAVGTLTLDELKRRYTDAVLRKCKGNKTRAARILGVSRTTLLRRGAGEEEGAPEAEGSAEATA